MKKSVAVTAISALLVLSIVLGTLYLTNNAGKQKEINDLAADVAEKAGQIETLNADVADKAGQIETLTADAAEKAGQIETLTADAAEKAEQIETLTADAAEKAGQIETLKADAAEKAGQIETLKVDVTEKTGQIETLKADVEDKAGQIETLNADVADKAGQIETLNADVADKAGQIETLNADVADKAGRIKALNADVADKAGQIKALNADVADKAEQIETLNADVEDKAGQIEALTAEAEEKKKQIDALSADNGKKDERIQELSNVVREKDEQIETLRESNAEKDRAIEELQSSGDPGESAFDSQEDGILPIQEAAEEEPEEASAAGSAPFTVTGRITVNQQLMPMFGAMFTQQNPERLAVLNSLIAAANDLEIKVLCDGPDAEGFISLRGENLASSFIRVEEDRITLMSDVIPNYFFTVSKDDLTGITPGMALNADPQKLIQAVMNPVMKIPGEIRFGETEMVEETFFGTAFTLKAPVDMTTKECGLLILNTMKEILENEDIAPLIEKMKEGRPEFSVEQLDRAIESLNSARDEDLPVLNAAMYANSAQDTVFSADFSRTGEDTMHLAAGTVNGSGVFEFRMGSQAAVSAKAGNEGLCITIGAAGMDIVVSVVPEVRANGAAVTARITVSGMELLKAEFEKTNGGALTGSFDTAGRTGIGIRELKENGDGLRKAILDDIKANYAPVLIEKLRSVAPEMNSALEGTPVP